MNSYPNFSKWAAETIKQDSVTYIWDEEAIVKGTMEKMAKTKAEAK